MAYACFYSYIVSSSKRKVFVCEHSCIMGSSGKTMRTLISHNDFSDNILMSNLWKMIFFLALIHYTKVFLHNNLYDVMFSCTRNVRNYEKHLQYEK